MSKQSLANIVIVGRPNVGKSLLFNRLLGRRQALVHNAPGMTLDTLRERLTLPDDKAAWLIDTGGIAGEEDDWSDFSKAQTQRAAADADLFILVVDAKTGRTTGDGELARQLRRRWRAPWLLVVNKAEGLESEIAVADFRALGAEQTLALSAKQGGGLDDLRQHLADRLTVADGADTAAPPAVALAVVGRPNVGKSTLVNRLLGDARMIISERPGTTRDAVSSELRHTQGDFLLIDTAGMKRKRAVAEREKISVVAARSALAAADVALVMIDLSVGVTHQDKRIADLAEKSGCAIILLANKSDLLSPSLRRRQPALACKELLPALSPPAFALSATAARPPPIGRLLEAAARVARTADKQIATPRINRALSRILARQAPRRVGAFRPKLRYAHQGGNHPFRIVIHGNGVQRLDESYCRYLANAFSQELSLAGVPVKIVLRSEDNPYA